MRIAVVTQSRDRVGGVEAYLQALLPPLAARHAVAFFSASTATTERGAMVLPSSVPALSIEPSQPDGLNALRSWRPDVIFAHGLEDPAIEADLLDLAPSIIVEHTYSGTCISSSKTMSWPAPCSASAVLARRAWRCTCQGSAAAQILSRWRVSTERSRRGFAR